MPANVSILGIRWTVWIIDSRYVGISDVRESQCLSESANADLKEEVYMEQPKGLEETGKLDYVCRLKKSRKLRVP